MRKPTYSLLWFAPVPDRDGGLLRVHPVVGGFGRRPSLCPLPPQPRYSWWSGDASWRRAWSATWTRCSHGQRFAQAKGAAGGTFITFLLRLPTPVVDWVTDNLILMTTGSGETPERDTVYVGMMFGMGPPILMQALGTVLANAIWNRRIGGNAPIEADRT